MESGYLPTLPTDPSGVVWQQIVRLPFQDCSGFVSYLSQRCEKVLCGEHPADGKAKVVHCHIMLVNPKVSHKAIEKERTKLIKGAGNSLMLKTEKTRQDYDSMLLGAYITKGNVDYVKYYSGYAHHDIVLFCKAYTSHAKVDSKAKDDSPKDNKTHWDLIQEARGKMKKIEKYRETPFGEVLEDQVEDSEDNFLLMCDYLNKYHVKTCIYDLERWWFSLLRIDRVHQQSLYRKISSRLV